MKETKLAIRNFDVWRERVGYDKENPTEYDIDHTTFAFLFVTKVMRTSFCEKFYFALITSSVL